MKSARTVRIRVGNIRLSLAHPRLVSTLGGKLEVRRAAADGVDRIRLRFTGDPGDAARSHVGHGVTLRTQMSVTDWLQRPPEPAVDLTAGWLATPGTVADLIRLRHTLPALVRHRSGPAGDDADLEDLLLVFEELASNGLRHGRPPVRVVVASIPAGWLLDVSDAAADTPPVPAPDRDPATGGLGLPLVAALSAAHGWTVDGDRKHIWARIDAGYSARRSPFTAPRLA